MGNQTFLSGSQVQDLQLATQFSDAEIKRLFKRFKKLDTDHSGALSAQEFMAVPELEHNPLVKRVVETFDSDGSGEVDFQEFISALSIFATMQNEGKKYKFTFNMYDCDHDGFISNKDLFQVLKAMVGGNLNDMQLQQLVDRTIIKGDKDRDGKLSYDEFVELVADYDLGDKMTIDPSGNSH